MNTRIVICYYCNVYRATRTGTYVKIGSRLNEIKLCFIRVHVCIALHVATIAVFYLGTRGSKGVCTFKVSSIFIIALSYFHEIELKFRVFVIFLLLLIKTCHANEPFKRQFNKSGRGMCKNLQGIITVTILKKQGNCHGMENCRLHLVSY